MAGGESKGGKNRPYWLPFVIALVMWMWLTYLFLDPSMVDRTRFSFSEWVTIGYLVTVIMLVWLLIWKITLNTQVAAEALAAATPVEKPKVKAKAKAPEVESEEEVEELPAKLAPKKPRKKRVVVAAGAAAGLPLDDELPDGLGRPEDSIEEEIEAMKDLPRVVEYPGKEPGGVYSDTLMKVDDNLILNFRILLGKVCHNCEELEDCKRRVEDKLDEDVFLYNFECKEGIKKELEVARKKREADEDKAEAAKDMVEEKAAGAKEKDDPEADESEPAETGEKVERPKKKAPAKKKTTKKKKTTTKSSEKGSKT